MFVAWCETKKSVFSFLIMGKFSFSGMMKLKRGSMVVLGEH